MDDFRLCGRDTCHMAPTCRRSIFVTTPTPQHTWEMFGPPASNGWCDSYIEACKPNESEAIRG